MAKQVTLNLKSLQSIVSELETIKAEVSKFAGTAAARLNSAREAVKDSVVVKCEAKLASASHADVLAYAEALVEAAGQAMDEAVTAHLRKSKDDGATSLTALRETFASKKEAADAMRNLLVQLGIEGAESITVPTLKGTGRVGTGTGKSADSKGQQFYRLVNGERHEQQASQNKLSSVAWYFGAAIVGTDKGSTNSGRGVTTAELTKFLGDKGVTVTAGTPWVYEVDATFSVGMDVTANGTDEEAPAT